MVIDVEKFQIAKYGLMQVTAIVYGVLACGAATKLGRTMAGTEHPMSAGYHYALLFRNYGLLFLILVIAWTAAASYFSSPLAKRQFDVDALAVTGLGLAFLFAAAGTVLAFWGVSAGSSSPHLITGSS